MPLITGAWMVGAWVTPMAGIGERGALVVIEASLLVLPWGSCPVWPKAIWAGIGNVYGLLWFGKARFSEY